MKIREIKDTQHFYRGFTIIGTSYWSESVPILCGRAWSSGGVRREYKIFVEDGSPYMSKYLIIKLKEAKENIDEFIKIRASNLERLKFYKDHNRSKQSLIDAKLFPSHFIEKYYNTL